MSESESQGCKVDRVRDKYDLYNLDERLLHRYEVKDEGVRQLERWFNERVLERAMEQAGATVLDGEVQNHYRLLTSDDVMDSARRDAKRELRDMGVNVDEVESDFVSYRTVLKHLRSCLDTDTSREYDPDIKRARTRVSKITSRIESVVNGSLERLNDHGEIHIENPTVSVSAKVRCSSCNRRHDAEGFLSDGGVCPCQEPEKDDDPNS
ncbi:MAG: rod-determining factor RdfA [Halobacteriaceae archaeon]